MCHIGHFLTDLGCIEYQKLIERDYDSPLGISWIIEFYHTRIVCRYMVTVYEKQGRIKKIRGLQAKKVFVKCAGILTY